MTYSCVATFGPYRAPMVWLFHLYCLCGDPHVGRRNTILPHRQPAGLDSVRRRLSAGGAENDRGNRADRVAHRELDLQIRAAHRLGSGEADRRSNLSAVWAAGADLSVVATAATVAQLRQRTLRRLRLYTHRSRPAAGESNAGAVLVPRRGPRAAGRSGARWPGRCLCR